MEKRQLGTTGLHMYPIAFGGNVFGWTIDQNKSFEILDAFTGAGFNFIDTADVYSRWAPGNASGESEAIIGNWLRERNNRSEVIIATKVGSDMGDSKKGLKKDYIIQAAEASLKRLKTDYIDLYQTHFDEESTPVQETLEAYQQLIKDGKVRYIGTSNMSPERIKESLQTSQEHGLPLYETLQPHYNMLDRQGYESTYEQLALANNLGVIPYFSLASGFLTGKYRTKEDLGKSARGGDMDKNFNERGFRILAALDKVAAQYNATPTTVALAWLINRPSITAPIVSATSISQLDSLIAAPKLSLTAEDVAFLTQESK
ncbi:alcohol dehydrogenase [Flavobacterium akiainvivens]|uniref:Alcohol dehydrogenase n=1 Tax=Flavobacterium akiainvivens TaxID=1202724 RepID=A0A0M9VJ84_9FLAO|nr:aldo/keto reductase [Flavobacterium akiainvivens]KOS07209.1 alcohol dehydrogenase [Flavobacterium akiainvivens]SFQ78312.1 Predicted oxidoreductase [Flavobacterium akiainvivens]